MSHLNAVELLKLIYNVFIFSNGLISRLKMVVFVIYNQIYLEFQFLLFALHKVSIIIYATTIHITRSEKMSPLRF